VSTGSEVDAIAGGRVDGGEVGSSSPDVMLQASAAISKTENINRSLDLDPESRFNISSHLTKKILPD
jgi:hypothetical protein